MVPEQDWQVVALVHVAQPDGQVWHTLVAKLGHVPAKQLLLLPHVVPDKKLESVHAEHVVAVAPVQAEHLLSHAAHVPEPNAEKVVAGQQKLVSVNELPLAHAKHVVALVHAEHLLLQLPHCPLPATYTPCTPAVYDEPAWYG